MTRWVSSLMQVDASPTLTMHRFSSTGSLILVLIRPLDLAPPVGTNGTLTVDTGGTSGKEAIDHRVTLYLLVSSREESPHAGSDSSRLFLRYWKTVLAVRKDCVDDGVYTAVHPLPVIVSYQTSLQNSPSEAEQLVEQIEACCKEIDIPANGLF